MSSSVDHSPEGHRIGHLSVEPDILVRWEQPLKFGADKSQDVAEHGQQDKTAVKRKYEPSPSRYPHRVR